MNLIYAANKFNIDKHNHFNNISMNHSHFEISTQQIIGGKSSNKNKKLLIIKIQIIFHSQTGYLSNQTFIYFIYTILNKFWTFFKNRKSTLLV